MPFPLLPLQNRASQRDSTRANHPLHHQLPASVKDWAAAHPLLVKNGEKAAAQDH